MTAISLLKLFVICYYGVLRAGGTVVNYNPLYVERELAFQIEDSETEIMITMDLKILYSKVEAMLRRLAPEPEARGTWGPE